MIVSRRAIVAAALASLPVRAFPQAAKVSRIGLVTIGAPESTVFSPAMAKEFAKLGYIEGKNVEFERRAAQGNPTVFQDLSTIWWQSTWMSS